MNSIRLKNFESRYASLLRRKIDLLNDKQLENRRIFICTFVILLTTFVATSQDNIQNIILFASTVVFIFTTARAIAFGKALRRATSSKEIAVRETDRLALDWSAIEQVDIRKYNFDDETKAIDLNLLGSQAVLRLLDLGGSEEGAKTLVDWLQYPCKTKQQYFERRKIIQSFENNPNLRMTILMACSRINGPIEINASSIKDSDNVTVPAWMMGYALVWAIVISGAVAFGQSFIFGAGIAYAIFYPTYLERWKPENIIPEDFFNSIREIEKVSNKIFDSNEYVLKNVIPSIASTEIGVTKYRKKIEALEWHYVLERMPVARIAINAVIPANIIIAYYNKKLNSKINEVSQIWAKEWPKLEASAALSYFGRKQGFVTPKISNSYDLNLENAAHPLQREELKIPNNIRIDKTKPFICLTGANTSGKSTLLRTIGLAVTLGNAGARVCAECAVIPRALVVTSIGINDNFALGRSRFMEEVTRFIKIKENLNQSGILSVVLIDEIFSTTNADERLLAVRQVFEQFREAKAIGVITTHDDWVQKEFEKNDFVQFMHMETIRVGNELRNTYRAIDGVSQVKLGIEILRENKVI